MSLSCTTICAILLSKCSDFALLSKIIFKESHYYNYLLVIILKICILNFFESSCTRTLFYIVFILFRTNNDYTHGKKCHRVSVCVHHFYVGRRAGRAV